MILDPLPHTPGSPMQPSPHRPRAQMWGSGWGWGGMARENQERWGKWGQMWEWVLEGPPSSSQGVGRRTQKAVILTDFCFCLAGSRDCQEREGGGEREGDPGRGRGQGKSQDKRGRESRADEER